MTDRSTIRVVAAEVRDQSRYLITQRSQQAILPNLWEFPGGRVRDGESDADALRRAVQMRLGIEVAVGECVMEQAHDYATYTLVLTVYQCTITQGTPEPLAVQALEWVLPEDFDKYPFPGADQQTVDALLSES